MKEINIRDILRGMVVAQGNASKTRISKQNEDIIVNYISDKLETLIESKLKSLYKFGQLDQMDHKDLCAERVEDFKNQLFKKE